MSHAVASAPAVDARSLARQSRADLDRLFAALPPPASGELAGTMRGTVVDAIGLGRLPPGLRAGLLAALRGPIGVWRGKRFAGAQGTNVWGAGSFERLFAAFRVEVGPAVDGSGSCVRLDYDVPETPLTVRAIVREPRRLGTGLFLVRSLQRAGCPRLCLRCVTF